MKVRKDQHSKPVVEATPQTFQDEDTNDNDNDNDNDHDRYRGDEESRPFDEVQEDVQNFQFFQRVVQAAQEERPSHDGIHQLDAGSLLKYYKQEVDRLSAYKQARAVSPHKQTEDKEDTITNHECLHEDIYALIATAPSICSQALFFATTVFVLQQLLLLLILFDMIDLPWLTTVDSNRESTNDTNTNAMQVPGGVPIRVNLAQAICMVLIVITMIGAAGDLPHGLGRLLEGYHPHHNSSRLRWFLTAILQTYAGISMTVVLFVLVMQAVTVIGMALIFAALSFVYEIDNISFAMGKHGYFTSAIQMACLQVTSEEHDVSLAFLQRSRRIKPILVLLMLIGLFVPYGILVHSQWNADYLCKNIYIQFDDHVFSDLPYYSGNFYRHKRTNEWFSELRSRIDDRVYYMDKSRNLRLAYCAAQQAWTISVNTTNPCLYLYKSSTTSVFDVTKIASLPWQAWDFKSKRQITSSLSSSSASVVLNVRCDDCDSSARGNCQPNAGTCVQNECVCTESRMGVHCHNDLPPCPRLEIDARTNQFPYQDGVSFSSRYQVLKNYRTGSMVTAQHRPVYVAYSYDNTQKNTNRTDVNVRTRVDLMLFNGRRWVVLGRDPQIATRQLQSNTHHRIDRIPAISKEGSFQHRRIQTDDESISNEDALLEAGLNRLFGSLELYAQVLALDEVVLADVNSATMAISMDDDNTTTLGLLLDSYRPYFYSEAVDSLSPLDTLSPIKLNWYRAVPPTSKGVLSQWSADESSSLGTLFLCATCNSTVNPCLHGGICIQSNIFAGSDGCRCNEFYTGALCEKTKSCHEYNSGYCLNNGTCHPWSDDCTCPGHFFGSVCQYTSRSTVIYEVDL